MPDNCARRRRIIFTLAVDLKNELADTAILTALTTMSCMGHGPVYF